MKTPPARQVQLEIVYKVVTACIVRLRAVNIRIVKTRLAPHDKHLYKYERVRVFV